jgi:hypothetical protein
MGHQRLCASSAMSASLPISEQSRQRANWRDVAGAILNPGIKPLGIMLPTAGCLG